MSPKFSIERGAIAFFGTTTFGIILAHALVKVLGHLLGTASPPPAVIVALGALGLGIAASLLYYVSARGNWRPRSYYGGLTVASLVTALPIGLATGEPPLYTIVFLLVAGGYGVGLRIAARLLPHDLDGAFKRRRRRAILWAALAVFALFQTLRISTFMLDPNLAWASAFPLDSSWRHMCLAAYVYAADLSRQGHDELVYTPSVYAEYDPSGANPSQVRNIEPYISDSFLYPPPFLLLPRGALALSDDFLVIRTTWFSIQAMGFAVVAVLLAVWVRGRAGLVAALLIPAVWASIPTTFNFQYGQFHLAAMTLSIVALLAFEKKLYPVGGLALALAIVAKVSPGILVLYLLVQRRLKPVAWTAVFCVLLVLLALVSPGPAVFRAFLTDHFSNLASGRTAFGIESVDTIANNLSIYGTSLKLRVLGVAQDTAHRVGVTLSWIYTLLLIGAAVVAARKRLGRAPQAQVWLALLSLGALRAPVAPGSYVAVTALWLLTFLAGEIRSGKGVFLLVMCWILLFGLPALPSPELTVGLSFIAQAIFLAIPVRVLLRGQVSDPVT